MYVIQAHIWSIKYVWLVIKMHHITQLVKLVFVKKDISEMDLLVQNVTLHVLVVQEDLQTNVYSARTRVVTLTTVYVQHQHQYLLNACPVMS